MLWSGESSSDFQFLLLFLFLLFYYHYFMRYEFLTLVLDGGLSLESEWQQHMTKE